jgi:hypothetical protein
LEICPSNSSSPWTYDTKTGNREERERREGKERREVKWSGKGRERGGERRGITRGRKIFFCNAYFLI